MPGRCRGIVGLTGPEPADQKGSRLSRGEDWKTAGSDDWAVGAGISYGYPINDRVSVGPGFITAYDFNNSELRSEIDFSVSVAF